jgi:hypothetical protein
VLNTIQPINQLFYLIGEIIKKKIEIALMVGVKHHSFNQSIN